MVCIFDPFGINAFASMILSLSVSSMKNAINSVRQFGQSAALAWLEWFHWSIQSEWKMWLQWVWIRSPIAVEFLMQGWMQIEQSIINQKYDFEFIFFLEFIRLQLVFIWIFIRNSISKFNLTTAKSLRYLILL